MCWTCNINKLKAQIAKEDINVYKVVKSANRKYCVAPFMDYTYYLKDIQPSLTLEVMIEPRSTFAKITEGYHSYSSVNFVFDSVVEGIFGGYVKTIQCGNRKEIFRVDNSLYLATFIIPAGTLYCLNNSGEVVSNRLIYTGNYIKVQPHKKYDTKKLWKEK